MWLQLLIGAAIILFFRAAAATRLDGARSSGDAVPLNVHMVPHSHDDPGWLKTADQYYTGSNSSIYLASVQYIFDSVVDQLSRDPEKTYTMCEISFLARWWSEQTDETKAKVRGFVKSKQLAIVNGGWVMHDEAAAHYVSMVDQTTLGHAFLTKELNYKPKVGWQIDPFGHSNTHAWLSYEVGFDSLFFGRIDWADHDKRMAEKKMEMVWKGSSSQSHAAVFTGAFTSGNYGAPQGLCLDRSCVYCRDDPVEDDAKLSTYNLEGKLDILINAIEYERDHSVGNNVMLKMGADFTYENANSWYKSMDVLIREVRARCGEKYNIFYSTPDKYTEMRAAEAITWSVKKDDFFPYSDCAHCFWSGYFTSRPTLKLLERKSSSFLQTLRQVLVGSGPSSTDKQDVATRLTAAVGLVNHHDAITGTSKQHVADDYTKILAGALTQAEELLVQQVSPLPTASFSVCRYSNESSCPCTQALAVGQQADVLVYNPLPRTDSQVVRVLLTQPFAGVVDALSGAPVPSSIFPQHKVVKGHVLVFAAESVKALKSRQYRVTIYASAAEAEAAGGAERAVETDYTGKAFSVNSKLLSLDFDAHGLLQHVKRLDASTGAVRVEADVSNDLRYYVSYGSPGVPGFKHPAVDSRAPTLKNIVPDARYAAREADVSTQASGAYLFRPFPGDKDPQSIAAAEAIVGIKVLRTSRFTDVVQTFSDWAMQIVRINDVSPAVELDWSVGSIPVGDGLGKEVVSKFTSSLFSGKKGANVFYTDANGREFQKRVLNYRPTWDFEVHEPIAGNFYPVTAAMYLKDEAGETTTNKNKAQLSILCDRAQAAASLQSGEMEFMVHRRLLADDERGVNEALNETSGGLVGVYPSWTRQGQGIRVGGKHLLLLSELNQGMKELRMAMDRAFAPMEPLFSSSSSTTSQQTYSLGAGLGAELPANVQLMTLQWVPRADDGQQPNTLLVRLAHQFAVGEDVELSRPATIDLAQLLAPLRPITKTLVELNLSGNQQRGEMLKNKVNWDYSNGDDTNNKAPTPQIADGASSVVTLTPMEIRTFTIQVEV